MKNKDIKNKRFSGDNKQDKKARPAIIETLLSLRQNLALNCIMLAIMGLGVGLISLLLGAAVFGMPVFRDYFDLPVIVLLNLLPPILLMFMLYFISGRMWIAFTFPALLTLGISMIHFFKIQLRGDPLMASDIAFMREAGTILNAYTLTMNWKIYLAIAAFVIGGAFSAFALKSKLKKPLFRIISSLLTIAVSVVLYKAVYTSADIYINTIPVTFETEWSSTRDFISKGFLYPFIHYFDSSLKELWGNLPDWYDEKLAKETLESYGHTDIPNDKKVNIISIMLEAYTDLTHFDVLEFTEDVYGPVHKLQEESVSGMLVTNVFGGETIDTERLFLTGNTRRTSYSTATNSYVHYLKSQGYHVEGLHSGDKWFYDRRPINKNLGLDEYYFLEDYENGARTDAFFFPAVMDLYTARDQGKPYFSYNLSYQNHGAYDTTKTKEPYVIAQNGMSDESFYILNNYLTGIMDTNKHIESFVESLRGDPEPVVVLIFGDHMPWLGNSHSVYSELGISVDRKTEDGYINYYSTQYYIWANDAAKNVLGNEFKGKGASFSPNFLMGEVFSLCSWEGEAYMQVLREMQAIIDVVNTPIGKFREYGKLTETLTPEGDTAFRKLRLVEIYRLNNFAY